MERNKEKSAVDEETQRRINEEMRTRSNSLASMFRTCLRGPGRFIGIDDLCGTLITRDPLPPGAIFEGTVVILEEPAEALMTGGALEIIIRKRITNTLTAPRETTNGPTEKD